MMQNKITKKQHYVPRTYLRGFSEDEKRFWSYTLEPFDEGTLVPIDSICRENYLYEVRDLAGEFVVPNFIEKVLSELEKQYRPHLHKLRQKAFAAANYSTKSFFTTEEKTFWKTFVAVQMMRGPEIIEAAEIAARDFLPNNTSENELHMLAISQCMPFFHEIKPDDVNVFIVFMKPLLDMSIAVGVDKKKSLFTSDSPVYCYAPQHEDISQIDTYERIVFPLDSELALLLIGGETQKDYDKNRAFLLDANELETVKLSIAYAAQSRIFSRTRLSNKDIKIIRRARSEKEEDLIQQRG